MLSYSTVVFDVGGTLLQLNYDALARLYVMTGATLGVALDFEQARAVIQTLENEVPRRQQNRQVSLECDNGKGFWNEFYTDSFRRLGVKGDVSCAVTEIRELFQRGEFEALFDDVIPTLTALRARGKRLGILSNFSPNLESLLRQLGIYHFFFILRRLRDCRCRKARSAYFRCYGVRRELSARRDRLHRRQRFS